MKRLLSLLCLALLSVSVQAQTYKQIGINDGLSHRHVYSIEQDNKGYIWLLTHEGVDRYNGSEYKHYNFYQQDHKLNTSIYLKSLFYTPDNILWEVGSNGQVFRYNEATDQFDLFYNYPSEQGVVAILDFGYIDDSGHIWLGNKSNLQIYNYKQNKPISISQHPIYTSTGVAELGDNHYAIGTYQGVYFATIKNDSLQLGSDEEHSLLKRLPIHVDHIYYHKNSDKLIIATLKDGLYTYELKTKELSPLFPINNTSINQIVDYGKDEVLIATSGAGIYLMNLRNELFEPYITADYSTHDGMSSNNIKDIFIDNEKQIWMANYPTGVTVCQEDQSSYTWYRHILNDTQSLINDEVNYILEDSSKDIWFATTNGVSMFDTKHRKWKSFLSSYNNDGNINNHMFISLCEVKPDIMWVGGYNSGIYEINKRTGKTQLLNIGSEIGQSIQLDRHIKAMLTDSEGNIWVGGQFNLRQIDYATKSTRFYNEFSLVTAIEEKDKDNIWIGTAKGLYLLNKRTAKSQLVTLPDATTFINSLCQGDSGNVYIATNEGLFIFVASEGIFKHFHKDNSTLISNNIRSVVSDRDKPFVYLAYENALARVDLSDYSIQNWTSDQNLPVSSFSLSAATQLSSGNFIFGSIYGAIGFDQNYQIPKEYDSRLILEELEVNQNRVNPSGNNKILTSSLDSTTEIELAYNQNNFSIKVGSINFKYPSNILYTWILEDLYDEWSLPTRENKFSFTNLLPGDYTFKVKAISNEDSSVLGEKEINITIKSPIWWNIYSKLLYLLIIGFALYKAVEYFVLRYKKKIVDSTKQFYYNAAHDIKVPLQLIKEPIEEIRDSESLSQVGLENIRVILRNLNVLLAQNDNVINYERMERNKSKLFLSEHRLGHYITAHVSQSIPIATLKKITLNYFNEIKKEDLKVWFDKSKLDTILSNLLNECITRSKEQQDIDISLGINQSHWVVNIKYEGEEITKEQLKAIKDEDSVYLQESNSQKELGLSLVCKLVQIHKGSIFVVNDNNTTTFTINFPLYVDASMNPAAVVPHSTIPQIPTIPLLIDKESHIVGDVSPKEKPLILLVEDDKELIQSIIENLRDTYIIKVTNSAQTALRIAKDERPDIIISKLHPVDMKGTDLSRMIKGNLETSHISVVLLTDKNDEKHIIKGLENGADEFILKPFSFGILKASLANLLANKKRLQGQYASLEMENSIDCANCSTNLDWTFIASVRDMVIDHMAEPDFTIDKLCALLNMSRTSFYNKLKDLTEQSPSDFIRFIKLKHAATLLTTTNDTIAEIAEKTGFNDAKYFREVFKKHFDMTPSKYAKENR